MSSPQSEQKQLEQLAEALRAFPKKSEEPVKQEWLNKYKLSEIWPKGYELCKALCNLPNGILEHSGRFLYSDISTLREHDPKLNKLNYYILGINPAGEPDDYHILRDEISQWFTKNQNAFIDEPWPPTNIIKGNDPYQLDVKELCRTIGEDTCKVCASNLIFERSNGSKNLKCSKLNPSFVRNVYWPVHKAVMDIVKPNIIFVFGITAYKIVYGILKIECGLRPKIKKHSGCSNKIFYMDEGYSKDGQPLKLFGIPYPNYGFRLAGHWFLPKIAEECRITLRAKS